MMESKVKRKALSYGLAAILFGAFMTAMIISFDIIQLDYTPGEPPI